MKNRIFGVATLLIVAVTLTACASTATPAGTPEPGPAASSSNVTVTPVDDAYDVAEGNVVTLSGSNGLLILGGSGSCPPIVKEAAYDEADTLLTVTLDDEAYADTACTMDYRTYGFELELQSGEFSPETQAVLLSLDTENEITVVVE